MDTPFGTPVKDYARWDLIKAAGRVSEGLPSSALEQLKQDLGLTDQELASSMLMTTRTVVRRRNQERLEPDESERVYRLGRLLEIAADSLGGLTEARGWFREPNFALQDRSPLELARTQPGAQLVERLLWQLQRGISV